MHGCERTRRDTQRERAPRIGPARRFFALCAALGLLFGVPAFAARAEERESSESEAAQHQMEEQRERAQQEMERAREQMKKDQERAAEQARRQPAAREGGESREAEHEDAGHERRDGEEHGSEHGGEDRHENEMPDTVEELVRRWFEPDEKQKSRPAPGQPGSNPGSNDVAIDLPSAGGREILAANASRATIERAKKLGFSVRGSAGLSQLGLDVTRLVPPPGMSPGHARQLLKTAAPGETFAPNVVYKSYRAATGDESREPSVPARAARKAGNQAEAGACEPDRCYGASVVRWRPQLPACARKVRIGVIDTSIDAGHPAFVGRRIRFGMFQGGGQPAVKSWHGTGVLALLAGDPRSGTPGLVPDASFYVADVFFADESGQPASDTVSLLKALDWMDAWDVQLINMSLSGPRDELVRQAIEKLAGKGVIVTAAAGNEGPAAPASYPAAYEPVVAVTAIDRDMRVYRYANRGKYIDVAAPGVRIWTAMPDLEEGYQSGTSFAVPYVTAILAAVYEKSPVKTKEALLGELAALDLGTPGRDPVYGRGVLLAPDACAPREKDRIEQARDEPGRSPAPETSFSTVLSFGPGRRP